MHYAQKCASEAWRRKRLLFNEQVEKSWNTQGGSFPFRLIKDPQKPPVTDLTVQLPIRLTPQKWNQVGKSWLKVHNVQDFPVQCELLGLDTPCRVLGHSADAIQVDHLLTRREAASLYREFVTADPAVWTDHFLQQWGQFWNRDTVDQDSVDEDISTLPDIPKMSLPPLCLDDWKRSLQSAKRRTMRGADGWSVQELHWLPDAFSELLIRILRQVEQSGIWPQQLSTWVLVLLRKTNDPFPTWSMVRPIMIAGVVYRIWSRVRTAQFMRHARTIAKPLASPCLSTRAIWTFLGDLISRKIAARSSLAGLVLDIVKAFNILDRGLLRAIMLRLGFDDVIHVPYCVGRRVNIGFGRSVAKVPPEALIVGPKAQLDTLKLPDITRSIDDVQVIFYTGGACLHPRDETIRIAAGAVLRAKPGGVFDVVWSDLVPGSCQSIYRAELLAVSCAFLRSSKPVVFTDSNSVARTAQRILSDLRSGFTPVLPCDHRDFWAFFLTAARGTDLEEAQVHWIKGHIDFRKVTGVPRTHAWYSHWADVAAKHALRGHFPSLYRSVL
eukprot:s4592_g3.t1